MIDQDTAGSGNQRLGSNSIRRKPVAGRAVEGKIRSFYMTPFAISANATYSVQGCTMA
jgi:hypothetical protein